MKPDSTGSNAVSATVFVGVGILLYTGHLWETIVVCVVAILLGQWVERRKLVKRRAYERLFGERI